MLSKLTIRAFVIESNRIEGIARVTAAEVESTEEFFKHESLSVDVVCNLQKVYAPNKPLRTERGMDVRVGSYIAPPGALELWGVLDHLCRRINKDELSPWHAHIEFEMLHPFMDGNGRTGRAVWAWHMLHISDDPFALPFLHRFYYQTLANAQEHQR